MDNSIRIQDHFKPRFRILWLDPNSAQKYQYLNDLWTFENLLFLVENIEKDKKGLFWAFELEKV